MLCFDTDELTSDRADVGKVRDIDDAATRRRRRGSGIVLFCCVIGQYANWNGCLCWM